MTIGSQIRTLTAEANAAAARLRRRDLTIERDADVLDVISAHIAHDIEARRINSATARLHQVQAAILREARGEYGICADCGRTISEARLTALPWTDCCRECAELREAGA